MPQIDIDGANSKISADKIEGQSGTTVTVTAGHNLAGSGSGLTALNGSNISTGTVADARISALTASKLTGALPAISGASLTGITTGKILQIVANSTGVTTNINSTSNSDAGFDVSITPTSASSKIMVFGTFSHGQDDGPAGSLAVVLIYKDDTTAIEEMTIGYEAAEAAPSYEGWGISALDGPVGSTSTIKYSIYARTSNSTSQFRFSNTAGTFWAIEFDPA